MKKLFAENQELTSEEKANFNGLGNFVFLEEHINKSSLKDKEPSKKFNDDGFDSSNDKGYFFPRSTFALVGELREEYKDNYEKYGDLDVANNWLKVIVEHYLTMKEKLEGLF